MSDELAVADWRRRVFALYGAVRATPDPAQGHALWRAGRDDLLATHPASPVDVGDLDVWWLESYGGGLFVPVKDALAGTETYGGGRYLVDTVKGADLGGDLRDGRLVVDLNFAYNPSCAYSPRWHCPLAPPGNTVKVPLRAGELTPTR